MAKNRKNHTNPVFAARMFPGPSGIQNIPGMRRPDNTMLMQPASISIAGESTDRVLKSYNQHLVDDLGMMTRRDIKKKDIVDLRPILDIGNIPKWQAPYQTLRFEEQLYIAKDYYYCFIPCFEEGVYHVNNDRYIYWKLKDLDLTKHRMTLWLQDFVYYAEGCGWQPGVYGDVGWTFGDPDDERSRCFAEKGPMRCDIAAMPNAVTDYVQMYQLVDTRKLNWSKQDYKAWKIVMEYAKKGCSIMQQKTGAHNLDSLAVMFTNYTIETNRILSEHKAAGRSKPASKEEHEKYLAGRKQAKSQPDQAPQPIKERRIRTIGPISITSRSVPKPGHRAMANYTKVSWETRGHIRTLKSGKKVYVKKSIHHRKALMTPENAGQPPEESAPVTIRILPQDDKNK